MVNPTTIRSRPRWCLKFIRNETIHGTIDAQSLYLQQQQNENENRLVFETVSKYIARTKWFDWTKMWKGIECTYWVVDYEDSVWQLRLCNSDLNTCIFCFNLTCNCLSTPPPIMIILLTTLDLCYQYLIREKDLHKFYILFYESHRTYIYLNTCNCMLQFHEINIV